MRLPVGVLSVLVTLGLVLGGCKSCNKNNGDTANADACEKIAVLEGRRWSPAEKDKCIATYGLGPNVRKCNDACLDTSKNIADYTDCSDDCRGGPAYPAFMGCQKKTT